MAHPLDGCRLKLVRARAHYTDLRRDIARVIGKERDCAPGVYEATGNEYVFKAPRAMAPKPEWSAIVGDAIHNVHAALDYLVAELVAANSGAEDRSYTGFPIFEDEAKYRTDADRKIKGVHQDAKAIIERLQPFKVPMRDGHPSEHPLAFLYKLEVRDKHKTLNVTTNTIDVRLHGFAINFPSEGPFGFPIGPHEKGAIMARLQKVGGPGLSPWLEVEHKIVFAADGPAAGEEVCPTVLKILHHVETRVLPSFTRFFDAG